MTGPEFAFEVRPPVLTAYAESLRARAAELAAVGEAVAAVGVEHGWFGRLPQSGFLADRCAAHHQEILAEVRELTAWLAAATVGLAESAGRYSAADRVVAGVAGAVETALGVGIEIPGSAPDDTGPDDTGPDDTGPDDAGPDDAGLDAAGPDEAESEHAGPDDEAHR